MNYDKQRRSHSPYGVGIGIFTLLSALYLLSYSGVFHSADEIYYVLNALQFTSGDTASLGKGGPFVLALSAISLVVESMDGIGRLQTMFLLNIPVTALAASFLFLLGIALGYDRRAALLTALLYGLATPAWVYSTALFREPWAALGLIAALYFAVKFRENKSILFLCLAAISAAIAITTRSTTSVVLPFLLLYVIAAIREDSPVRSTGWTNRVYLSLLALLLLGLAVVYTLSVVNQYRPALPELAKVQVYVKALAGVLISPGRGLLVYTPLIVLSVGGMVLFYRRHRREALVICGSVAVYVLMLAAYRQWWGGWGWGPRFLVPFLPYLILPIISILHVVFVERRHIWAGALVVALGVVGVAIQLTGVLVGPSMPAFNLDTSQLAFDLASAPIAWRHAVWEKTSLDVAWLQLADAQSIVISVLTPIFLLVALSAIVLYQGMKSKSASSRRSFLSGGAVIFCLVVAGWLLLVFSRGDQRYATPDGFPDALHFVLGQIAPGESVVVVRDEFEPGPYVNLGDGYRVQDPHIYRSRVYNRCIGTCPHYDEVVRDRWYTRPDRLAWLDRNVAKYHRIWVLEMDAGVDRSHFVTTDIASSAQRMECMAKWSGVHLCIYDTRFADQSAKTDATGGIPFGDGIVLQEYEVRANDTVVTDLPSAVMTDPEETLSVKLTWKAQLPLERNYTVSLQLLDSEKNLVYQIDRQPGDGFLNTSSWEVGDEIGDRYDFILPDTLESGSYRLVAILYDHETSGRLPTPSGDSTDLAVIEIRPATP